MYCINVSVCQYSASSRFTYCVCICFSFFLFFFCNLLYSSGFVFFSCTLVNLNYLSIGWEGETGVYDMVWVWKYFVPMVMCVKLF